MSWNSSVKVAIGRTLTLFIMFIGVILSIISFKYSSIPYIFIAFLWLLLFIILILTSKTTYKKAIWFNLAFAVLLFGLLEVYSYFSIKPSSINPSRTEGTEGYYTRNEILGYGPTSNKIVTRRRYYNDELIYDVTYTIGEDGYRITPPAKSKEMSQCIVFFGGSFTFGEGINDYEAMPYIVGELQNYKVHNFGFHGYGPHQMLSAIDHGLINCEPKLVIYQALIAHVGRSAGYSSWDPHGPKYVLDDGELKFQGHFDDRIGRYARIRNKIIKRLEKSYFYFYKKFLLRKDSYTITDDNIKLFLEIVNASQRRLINMFPEVEFDIILWDRNTDDQTYIEVLEGLKKVTGNIHLVSNILPNFHEQKEKYQINNDTHPNALAHRIIAKYIVNNIIEK